MRKLLLALFLSISLLGCGGAFQVHQTPTVEQAKQDPIGVARQAIDQAYATHASITATLLQNYADKVITKEEKDSYAKRTAVALADLDASDDLLGSGDLSGSNARLILANKVFALIQAEVAKQAAKERAK